MRLPIRWIARSYLYHGWMIVDSLPAGYDGTDKNAPGLPVDSGITATHLLSGAEISYPGENQYNEPKMVTFLPSKWDGGTALSGDLDAVAARRHIFRIIDGAV